jgi:transcriptional regulator with XRE-family HTH domain
MIIEKIRKRIEKSGKSLNQIGRETGIDKAALSRIMHGGSCKVETADILLKYFGLELVPKTCGEGSRKKGRRKAGGKNEN